MTTSASLTQDELKTLVGQAALQYVVPGEIVGVGTGSTVNKFIDALATIKDQIHRAVEERLGPEVIHTGCRLGAFAQHEGGVVAHFFDRTGVQLGGQHGASPSARHPRLRRE